MQLFYSPELSSGNDTFTFSKEESHHIVKVLRKKEHDTLIITNGKGKVFYGTILNANPKECRIKINSEFSQNKREYHLHIAIAPTKMNERFEWFLEKATEIGGDEITPILCDNSERKKIKHERFEKIIQSAMQQSLQFYLPQLNPLVKFNDFIKKVHDGNCFIAHCENEQKEQLKRNINPGKNLIILIGPEGDFSKTEILNAIENNFKPISLGHNRLRTETAGIVACHTVSLLNEH